MPCESCNVQFGLITRKKSCYECRRLFCRNCLEKRQERILCQNCMIFTKRPLSKVDLGPLKVKDLIFYLQSKHISTSGCVEKDDLINLVIAHVNSGASSPRSPIGSTGSGNAGVLNFSSASSTGGSSGGGGGRGSHSGASSRYGNFYTASAENCANTFDQIKNTCQNLFSSITEKLGSDIPKAPNFGPRFSSSPTEDSVRSRGAPEGNVFQQPRFGSNDVYLINPQQTTGGSNSVSQLIHEAAGSGGGRSEIVPNERNFSPTNDNGAGSGITSGADSSGNTSSVPSPEHPKTLPQLRSEDGKLSLSIRIENMLSSEASQNACDCSDVEDEPRETPRRKESKKASSEDNLLIEAGPSQSGLAHMAVPESKTDTSTSSFDELNAECVHSPLETVKTDSIDGDNWQIINNSESIGNNENLPGIATTTTATMTETTENPRSLNLTGKQNENDPINVPSSQIIRRRSDSYLVAITHQECITVSPTRLEPRPVEETEPIAHSSHTTNMTTNKCFKCGKRRNGIWKQLKKFRQQLETSTGTEVDKQRQLEAFLNYLERRSKGSMDLSDTESITEEASVSLADGEPMDGAGLGLIVPQASGEGSSSDEGRQYTNYPRVEHEDSEKINMYSTGNQELANMSHIKLSDIKESADLDFLSVKQLKELLMLNRVDFKGCCEKPELRERVLRLWRDYKSIPSIEKLATDDLCKICMDAPIECVILECGHMTTCTACGKVLSECPICRQYIVRVVRFFRA